MWGVWFFFLDEVTPHTTKTFISSKLSRQARPTEQTGSVRRKQQTSQKSRHISPMWIAFIAIRERKGWPSLAVRYNFQ